MTRCTPVITHNKHISTPPTLAGLFFCFASAEDAKLLFCPATIQPHTSVYSVFSVVHAIIQQKRQNRLQDFAAAFLSICHVPAHTIQQPHKPTMHRLCHAGGHTGRRSTSTNTRYHRYAGRCTGQHSRPIIIMYIRVRPVMYLCQTVQRIADHASPAGSTSPPVQGQPGGLRSGTLHPAGQSNGRAHGGRRGTTGGLSPHLFSGFRPIANKGQQ